MLSVVICALCFCAHALGSDNGDGDGSNQFDKYFPGLTTKKPKDSMYRMFMFHNQPTPSTRAPPPRRRRITQSTTTTTTAEPEDVEGDFKILPVAKPVTNGHPFLDKDGKRGKKVYKREI